MVYNLVGICFTLDSHQNRLAKCDLALAIYIWLFLSRCQFGRPQLTSNNSRQSVKKPSQTSELGLLVLTAVSRGQENALSYIKDKMKAIRTIIFKLITIIEIRKRMFNLPSTSQPFSSTEKVSFPFFLLLAVLIAPAHEVLQFTYI